MYNISISFTFLRIFVVLQLFFHFQGFKEFLEKDEATMAKMNELKAKVEEFSCRFPMPGFDDK